MKKTLSTLILAFAIASVMSAQNARGSNPLAPLVVQENVATLQQNVLTPRQATPMRANVETTNVQTTSVESTTLRTSEIGQTELTSNVEDAEQQTLKPQRVGAEQTVPQMHRTQQYVGIQNLPNDMAIVPPLGPTMIPLSQLVPLSAEVTNVGLLPQTNVRLMGQRGETVFGPSPSIATLAPGASQVLTITPSINPLPGTNRVYLQVQQNETDNNPANNTIVGQFLGTDNTLALDVDGESLFLSNPNCVGNVFPITANTELNQIQWASQNGTGTLEMGVANYTISLFRMDDAGLRPETPAIFTTEILDRPLTNGVFYIFTAVPPTALLAGNQYFVCLTPAGGGQGLSGIRIHANLSGTDQGRVFNVTADEFSTINEAHGRSDLGAYVLRMVVDLPEDGTHLFVDNPLRATQIPLSQAAGLQTAGFAAHSVSFPRTLTTRASNFGTAEQTNVRFNARFNGTNLGTSSVIASLPSAAVQVPMTLTQDVVTNWPTTAGTFNFEIEFERDGAPFANAVHTFPLIVGGDVFAFDALNLSAPETLPLYLNISAGQGLGNIFPITHPTTLTHVDVGFVPQAAGGAQFTVTVYRMSTATARLIVPVAMSAPQVRTAAGGAVRVALQEPLVLLPGVSYFVSVNQLTAQGLGFAVETRGGVGARFVGSSTAANPALQGFGVAVRMVVDDNAALPPVLVSTSPALGGTNANPIRDIPVDTDIVFNFYEANLVAGDLDLITIYPAVAGFSANIAGNQLILTHDGLAFSTNYLVTVPEGTIVGLSGEIVLRFRAAGNCTIIDITTAPWVMTNFPLAATGTAVPAPDAGVFPPDCWDTIVLLPHGTASGRWGRNTAALLPGTEAHIRGGNSGWSETYADNWIMTPAIALPASGVAELSFHTRWVSLDALSHHEVWVSTSGTEISDFVKVYNVVPTPRTIAGATVAAWEQRIVCLEEFAGETIRVAFRTKGNERPVGGTSWDVSLITVQLAPVRIASTTPETDRPGAAMDQDIVIEFNRDITPMDLSLISIYPAVGNFTPALTDARTVTISHDGLTALTIYTVALPANTIEGLAADTFAFRTGTVCAPITSFPWREDFTPVADFPAFLPMDCWTIYEEYTVNWRTWERNTASLRPNSGTTHRMMHANAHAELPAQISWLITPALAIPAIDHYDLNFWSFWGNIGTIGSNAVWVSTTTNDISEFRLLHEMVPRVANNQWQEENIWLDEFAGQTIYLAFRYEGRDVGLASSTWAISEVSVARRPVRIAETSPYDGENDVALDTDIRVTFGRPINLLSYTGITFDPPIAGVSATVEDENVLVITTGGLVQSTLHRITIDNTVLEDFEGATWTFTTDFPVPDFPDAFDFTTTVIADRAIVQWTHGTHTTAMITLAAGDVWGDGTGYQMFLDETATLYGTEFIPAGDLPLTPDCWIYIGFQTAFSHSIPEGARGNVSCVSSHIVVNSSATIEVEPGIFDFVIANPEPAVRIWIPGEGPGRANDFVFAAGNHYTFTVVHGHPIDIDIVQLEVTSMMANEVAGFNVFLNDLTTPYATLVQSTSFEFTELAVGYHIAAVQAVGVNGDVSNIRPFSFVVTGPSVLARTPGVNETGVALDAPVSVTFNHTTVAALDLTGITFDPPVSGVSATLTNNNVISITHDGFDYATVYTVTIPAGTIEYVTTPITWSFRTVPNCALAPILASTFTENFQGPVFPPDCWTIYRELPEAPTTWMASQQSPRPGSTQHARQPVSTHIYTNWLITRPLEMPATGLYSLRFVDRVNWGVDGGNFDVLVSTTTNDIAEFTEIYSATLPLSPGASPWRYNTLSLEAFAGETIYVAFRVNSTPTRYGGNSDWTAAWDIDVVSIIPTPIAIAARTPNFNETNIPLNENVTVTFNQPVTATASPITGIEFTPAVANVAATIVDNVLTITHDGFDLDEEYTITIPAGTIEGFNALTLWQFRTTATTDLLVASTTPMANAINVAVGSDIVVAFNQHITAGNLSLIQISPAVANVQANIVGRYLVISHDGFTFGETYTVTLPVGTITGLTTEFAWSFEAFTPPTAPWHEGFEWTGLYDLPSTWTTTNTISWRTRAGGVGTAFIPPHTGFRQLTSYRHDGGAAWAFSEGVLLTAGTTYEISFAYLAQGSLANNEPDNFRVRLGTGQSVAEMTVATVFEQITSTPTLVGTWTTARYFFTPTEDGVFYLGFERLHAHHTGGLIRIDDVRIEEAVPYRLEITADFLYTQLPVSQFRRISAEAMNTGTATQTNVMLSGTVNGALIGFSPPVANLAPLASTPELTINTTVTLTEGPQTMILTVAGDQAAGVNNTTTFGFEASENVFARDTLTVPAATGYGFLFSTGGGTFATIFEVQATTTLAAVQLFFAVRGGQGQETLVHEYTIHVTPMVGPLMASTTALAYRVGTRIPGELNTLRFDDQELIILEPGRYAVSITSRGFVDLSLDYSATGAWYNMNLETGAMDFNLGLGAPGIRMVICDESLPRVPRPVALTAPANNAQNISVTPTLTWYDETPAGSGAEAVEYFVYFGTAAGSLTRVATVPAPTASWTVATALPMNTTHYWRVIASNALGLGEPSATWSFTTIEDPTNIVETLDPTAVHLFPNPVTDGFFYVEAEDMRQIEIIDMLGRTVMQKNVNSSRERVSTTHLQDGLYFVRVTTVAGSSLIRIVIQ